MTQNTQETVTVDGVAHLMTGETSYKIKGFPNSHVVFNYDEEVFYVFRDGIEIGSCLTHSDAKEILKKA